MELRKSSTSTTESSCVSAQFGVPREKVGRARRGDSETPSWINKNSGIVAKSSSRSSASTTDSACRTQRMIIGRRTSKSVSPLDIDRFKVELAHQLGDFSGPRVGEFKIRARPSQNFGIQSFWKMHGTMK